MGSHRDNKSGRQTTETVVLPAGSGDKRSFQKEERSSNTIKWSEEFQCFTVNGILAPIPLSAIPMETVAEDELQPESSGQSSRQKQYGSPSTIPRTEEKQQSAFDHAESRKRNRKTEGNEKFFFKLFKFPKADEQYLLEMQEVKSGGINRSHVFVYESNGRWKVGVYDLAAGDHVVLPVLQDPRPPIFHRKYQLSLQERLMGWTVEKRKRGNGKEDKFYYHRARQFRSFVEVTTYILYSCKLKELQIMNTERPSREVREAEAAEAIMIISSSNSHGNSKTSTFEEKKNSSAAMAATEQKRSWSPSPDIVIEKTPQKSNAKPYDSSSSSAKTAVDQPNVAEAWQVDENLSIGVKAVEKNEVELGEEEKIELVLEDPPGREKTEPHVIETDQFIDYVCDIFEDDASQTMSEIFGKPN